MLSLIPLQAYWVNLHIVPLLNIWLWKVVKVGWKLIFFMYIVGTSMLKESGSVSINNITLRLICTCIAFEPLSHGKISKRMVIRITKIELHHDW